MTLISKEAKFTEKLARQLQAAYEKTLPAPGNNSPKLLGSLQLLTDTDDKGICFLSTQQFAGVFCPAHPESYEGLPGANWLKSSGQYQEGKHGFDCWSQEEQREPNLLFPSFQTYISLSQTARVHGFCLFMGEREGGGSQSELF